MSAGRIVGRESRCIGESVFSQLECCGDPDVSGLIRAAALTQPLGGFPNFHPNRNLMADPVISFERAVPQFSVPDLVLTGEYYRDVLGFQIAGYWDGKQVTLSPQTAPLFAILQRDKVEVFFNRADQPDIRTGRAAGAYDAFFHVTGIDALAAELRARGADILDGPATRVYQQRELVIRDCNGLILCFAEETDARVA